MKYDQAQFFFHLLTTLTLLQSGPPLKISVTSRQKQKVPLVKTTNIKISVNLLCQAPFQFPKTTSVFHFFPNPIKPCQAWLTFCGQATTSLLLYFLLVDFSASKGHSRQCPLSPNALTFVLTPKLYTKLNPGIATVER